MCLPWSYTVMTQYSRSLRAMGLYYFSLQFYLFEIQTKAERGRESRLPISRLIFLEPKSFNWPKPGIGNLLQVAHSIQGLCYLNHHLMPPVKCIIRNLDVEQGLQPRYANAQCRHPKQVKCSPTDRSILYRRKLRDRD